jgi:hypothetical protein
VGATGLPSQGEAQSHLYSSISYWPHGQPDQR